MKNNLIIIPSFYKENTTDVQEQTGNILAENNTVVEYILHQQALPYSTLRSFRKLFPNWKTSDTSALRYYPGTLFGYKNIYRLKIIGSILDLILIYILLFLTNTKKIRKKILWVFQPYDYGLVKSISFFFNTVLYDCTDFHGLSKYVKQSEVKLIQAADIVVVNSNVLLSLHSKHRDDIKLVPQGFRLDSFSKYSRKSNGTKSTTKKVVIGYVGGINFRLDYELLVELIERNRQWQFILRGPAVHYGKHHKKNIGTLLNLTNITHGSSSNKDEIPAIIDTFDIAIIPYNSTLPFNKYSYPMKIFEYFYLGKPVVSTPIDELKRFPDLVKIGTTVDEWEQHIAHLLIQPWPKKYAQKQRSLALQNSWHRKVNAISTIIDKHHRHLN